MRAFQSVPLAAACVALAGLSVQAQAPAAKDAKEGAAKSITVDGCVQSPPPGSAATTKYILQVRPSARGAGAGRGTENAEGTGASTATAAGARGRGTGAGSAPAGPVRYRLAGEEKVIAPHMNHVVEVTGTLSGEPAPPAKEGGSSAGAAPITQTLTIESLKMVAALCS